MRTRRLLVGAAAVPAVLAAGVWTGLSGAGQARESAAATGFAAPLSAAQEVPKPTGVRAGARGMFTATLERNRTGGMLTWRLTFQGLTGRAMTAHIHLGARGRAGAVRVALCGPCQSGVRRSTRVDARTVTALLNGSTYVNVHTARNAAGEIRGQIVKAATAAPLPPAPPPVPLPPPTTTNKTTTYEDPYPRPR